MLTGHIKNFPCNRFSTYTLFVRVQILRWELDCSIFLCLFFERAREANKARLNFNLNKCFYRNMNVKLPGNFGNYDRKTETDGRTGS